MFLKQKIGKERKNDASTVALFVFLRLYISFCFFGRRYLLKLHSSVSNATTNGFMFGGGKIFFTRHFQNSSVAVEVGQSGEK